MPLWAEVMNTKRANVTAAELEAFFSTATSDDRLQAAGLRVIGERHLAFGRDHILTALGSGGPAAIDGALHALSWLESAGEGSSGRINAETILLSLLPTLTPARAATLTPLIADQHIGRPEKAALAERLLVAAAPAARPAVQLSQAKHLGADDDTLLQAFRELGPGEVQALISEGPRPLARLLLVLSAAEGGDVIAMAKAWLASDDTTDAQSALQALSHVNSVSARQAMQGAVKHADYKVRRNTMNLLAPNADTAERTLILSLVEDNSAPVRERLAELIGIGKWSDGLPVLVCLLRDRRDYARHPEHHRRSEPEFQVARAAANALQSFRPLPQDILQAVVELLEERVDGSVDVILHAELLGLLTDVDHPRAWSILERGLADESVVGEDNESLYPVRYAAAWAVVNRLQNRPTEIASVPWPVLEAAADHLDPQLAAPALLAIGLRMAVDCGASTLAALRGDNGTAVRRALALAMMDDKAAARNLAVRHDLLPEDHPLWPDQPGESAEKSSLARWPLTSAGRAWLEALSKGHDVEAVLLWIMGHRTGLPLGEDDFDPMTLRRQKGVPLTTFAEMFGME